MKESDRHYFYHASDRMEPVQRFLIAMTWYTLYRNKSRSRVAFVLYADPYKDPVLKDVGYQQVFDYLAEIILDERTQQGKRDAKFMGQIMAGAATEESKRISAITGIRPNIFEVVEEEKREQVSESVEPAPCSETGGDRVEDARTEAGEG